MHTSPPSEERLLFVTTLYMNTMGKHHGNKTSYESIAAPELASCVACSILAVSFQAMASISDNKLWCTCHFAYHIEVYGTTFCV